MDAKLIKTIRKVNGLNQYEMADRIGVSRSVLSKIEIDAYPISPKVKAKVTEEFGEQLELIKQIGGEK
jgi:transcriptional regulator with XRE-family HTH domain